ncbi:hypothetical protein PCO31110_02665 [Pandoraea communis]|uniref:Uncharacterized protein n=1 Tax=Pandoraea communis TaxID=2508297 RepID=A0A5E4VFW3_9BURK|nr:hypothetical protein PCO31110_02665 [Pandoraea communis]
MQHLNLAGPLPLFTRKWGHLALFTLLVPGSSQILSSTKKNPY